MKTIEIAKILAHDLSFDGLVRYITENHKTIQNERRMGRTSKPYEKFFKAGLQALEIRAKLEKEYD